MIFYLVSSAFIFPYPLALSVFVFKNVSKGAIKKESFIVASFDTPLTGHSGRAVGSIASSIQGKS